MKSRKIERKEAIEELTRKDILDSSVAVLLENGMKRFTMDRVALSAGVAKGTLYLYFQNKSQLLDAVVDYCFEPLEIKYDKISEIENDPITKLEQIVSESLVFVNENRKIFYELRSVIFNTMDQAIGNKKSWYWTSVNLISSVLDDAIISRMIKNINTTKIAIIFFDSVSSLMSHRIITNVKETIDDDLREIMDLFLYGITLNPSKQGE